MAPRRSTVTKVASGAALAAPFAVLATRLRAAQQFAAIAPATVWLAHGPVSEQQRIDAVHAYLAAVTDRKKAFQIPFADSAVRYENGLKTGFSGAHLKTDLYLHVQYSMIKDLIIDEIEVDPPGRHGVIRVKFTIGMKIPGMKRSTVVEDFFVPESDGLIHRIEAKIR